MLRRLGWGEHKHCSFSTSGLPWDCGGETEETFRTLSHAPAFGSDHWRGIFIDVTMSIHFIVGNA
jgi:hypothetical protein